jgi:hypothetical protein
MLIVLSLTTAIPLSAQSHRELPAQQTHAPSGVVGQDPNGTLVAFNASRAQFDLYTQQSASSIGPAPPAWFGGNFTGVSGTGFNVTIGKNVLATENVTWSKVNIPHGNFTSTTFLRFDWRGVLGNGTRASYFIYNGTSRTPVSPPATKFNQTAINGGPPSITAGTPPVACGLNDECVDVTRFIGFNLTLTFSFNSTAIGKGLSVRVSDIEVASADLTPINAFSHSMKFDPTNSTRVIHNGDLKFQYNATVTYNKPNTLSAHLNHTWAQMVISYYYPSSYQQISILQNGTALTLSTPIARGNCSTSFCTNSQYIALNMTSPNAVFRANINITANTVNLEAAVQTTLGGVPTSYWGPGDNLQVKVNIRQGVNVTGSNIVWANKTGTVGLTQTFTTTTKKGILLENFTSPLPQDTSLLGLWTVTSTFINGYDYGFNSTTFTLEQLGVSGFTYSGSNQRLSSGGKLTYASNSAPATNVNGYVFAVDSGSGAAPVSTPTITSGTGIYVSNITLLNGVFTSGGQLIMTFTLVNPTGVLMEANLTIDHEWVSGVSHNSNATIAVPSGAGGFPNNSGFVYTLTATFTPGGIQIIVTGTGNRVSGNLPPGNPPVTSLRQHSGLFKITVTSEPVSVSSPCIPSCSNSLESPAYAYVLVNPPLPGRLLASGSFTSISDGSFSTIISSGRILGASKLTFLSLGRDPNGLAITVQAKTSQESTILQSSIDNIPTATQNQPMAVTLHLTSNSTTVDMNVTISLNIEGRGVVQSQSGIYIPHGTTKDVSFNFDAPPTVGAYALTFFSPDYGAPLITGTLQVSVLQSSLQVIVPAIIGLVAAIVILLFFLFRKKPPVALEPSAKDRPSGGKTAKPNPGSSSSKSLT